MITHVKYHDSKAEREGRNNHFRNNRLTQSVAMDDRKRKGKCVELVNRKLKGERKVAFSTSQFNVFQQKRTTN